MRERYRVLIVEDDHVIRALLKLLIVSNFPAISVVIASNGQQGWAEFADEQTRPNLVLTDLSMETPLAGLELARKIKDVSPATPIILISGRDLSKVDVDNVNCCLTKPFSDGDLVQKIAFLLYLQESGVNN